jgi:hypothetical protein
MRPVLGALAVGIVLVMLVLGSRPTIAQAPQQGGYVQGWVYGFDMYDELVPLEWVNVTASNGNYQFVASTGANGSYEMFLPEGTYNLTVSAPGYKSYSRTIAVSDGSTSTVTVYLYESGVPVPEFPAQAISLLVMLGVATALLTKKATKRRPQR